MNRAAVALALLLAGCAETSLYAWGSYDASVAAMYATSGGFDPAAEIARLTDELEQTAHAGRLTPPGVRAHLGVLLCEAGNAERGIAWLEAEKAAFPEAAAFMDRLIARVRQGGT